MPGKDEKIMVAIEATENLSQAAKKGGDAVVDLGEKGKSGLSKIDQYAERARKQLERLTPAFNAVKNAAKIAATIVAAGFAAMLAVGIKALKNWAEQENATNKLRAAMMSLGNYTPELLAHYEGLASGLQKVTTYGDETILSVVAMLTTVGRLGGDVMPRAVEAVLDLSAAMGVDLQAAALLVAKAAAGETSMLKRYGIIVNEADLKTKGFAAVLDAISRNMGGAARAAVNTLAGAWQQLKNKMGDAFEMLGKRLTPIVMKMIEYLNPIIDRLSAWIEKSEQLNPVLIMIVQTINFLTQSILGLSSAMLDLIELKFRLAAPFSKAAFEEWEKFAAYKELMQKMLGELAITADQYSDAMQKIIALNKAGLPSAPPAAGGFLPIGDLDLFGEAAAKAKDELTLLIEAYEKLKQAQYEKTIQDMAQAMIDTKEIAAPLAGKFHDVNVVLEHQLEIWEKLQPYYDEMKDLVKKSDLEKKMEDMAEAVGSEIEGALSASLDAISGYIANVVAGVQGAGAQMAAALLGTVGETAVQIGKIMVLAGLAEEAVKRFAGSTAVGFGLALIALGSIVKGVASRMGNLGGGAAAGGGVAAAPSRSGAEYYGFGSQGSGAGSGPRYYFIETGGAVREGSRSEAVQYLERTTQGQTRRDLQRLVRTDELALNR